MEITEIKKPERVDKDYVELIVKGNYFKEMDKAIRQSPTASMAVLMFKKYCTLPNLKPTFAPYWEKLKDEKIKYGFFTLWVEYNSDLEVEAAYFRLSSQYRVKKFDDLGKAATYQNVRTGKIFPAFNKDKKVLQAQVDAAGGFENFSGQIYQYNTTTAPYEFSVFVPVFDWMRIESDTPTSITAAADNSLFGNNIFLMKRAAESSADVKILDGVDAPKKLSNTDRVVGALRNSKSVKNSGVNHVITITTDEDLDKCLKKVEIGNNINIDKFNTVDDKAGKKICTAAYCFPQILANPSEGLFGNSGEAYQAAIDFWAETCEFEALKIEKAFLEIGVEIQVADPDAEEQQDEENQQDQATLDAQATLRGSVGGVTSILQVQTSYSQKLTSRESALAIFELVFGFSPDEAERLLGTPVVVGPPADEPPAVIPNT